MNTERTDFFAQEDEAFRAIVKKELHNVLRKLQEDRNPGKGEDGRSLRAYTPTDAAKELQGINDFRDQYRRLTNA